MNTLMEGTLDMPSILRYITVKAGLESLAQKNILPWKLNLQKKANTPKIVLLQPRIDYLSIFSIFATLSFIIYELRPSTFISLNNSPNFDSFTLAKALSLMPSACFISLALNS